MASISTFGVGVVWAENRLQWTESLIVDNPDLRRMTDAAWEDGWQKGIQHERMKIAQAMLNKGITMDKVKEIICLSKKEIETLLSSKDLEMEK